MAGDRLPFLAAIKHSFLLCSILLPGQVLAANLASMGVESDTVVFSLSSAEVSMFDIGSSLIFQNRDTGKTFVGKVLRLGGNKAVVSPGVSRRELRVGAEFLVWPPYSSIFPSPQTKQPALLYQIRQSSFAFPFSYINRKFTPQRENPANYSGFSAGVRPEWVGVRPHFALGSLVSFDSLKQSGSVSLPSTMTRTAFEPHVMLDLSSALSLGGRTRYWLVRHSDLSDGSTTHYDYSMALFDFGLVLHGMAGELGLFYGTGSKVLPKISTTVVPVKGTTTPNTRFLISPPITTLHSRMHLGGGLSVTASISKALVSDSLYENSDFIQNSTVADSLSYRFGGEVITGGGSKFELFGRREDPFTLHTGAQPRYVSTYGVESLYTTRIGSLLDLTVMLEGASGSRLFKYQGTVEEQSFAVQEWTGTLCFSWLLGSLR